MCPDMVDKNKYSTYILQRVQFFLALVARRLGGRVVVLALLRPVALMTLFVGDLSCTTWYSSLTVRKNIDHWSTLIT